MESADGSARNRYEGEGKYLSGEHRPGAIGELRERRHLERRQHDHDPQSHRQHYADLDEGGEVVARGEQEPHRQNRREEAVTHYQKCEGLRGERERRCEHRILRDPASGVKRQNQKDQTDRARLQHLVRSHPAQIYAHEERRGNRQPDRDNTPRTRLERVHHHEREHGNEDDHYAEHCDQRRVSRHRPDLFLRHLPE